MRGEMYTQISFYTDSIIVKCNFDLINLGT